jgi:hypothetical protein
MAQADSAVDTVRGPDVRIAKRGDRSTDKKRSKRKDRKHAKKQAAARIARFERIGIAGMLLGVGALIGVVAGSIGGRSNQR